MRIPSGVVDQYIPFVGIKGSDTAATTRQTGMQGKFRVYRSRNGADWTIMTTPLVTEGFPAEAPGCYWLLADEDMSVAAGNYSEIMAFHVITTDTAASTDSIYPVTMAIELYDDRMTTATGRIAALASGGGYISDQLDAIEVSVTYATKGIDTIDLGVTALETSITYATKGIDTIDLGVSALETSVTYATRGIDQILIGLETATDSIHALATGGGATGFTIPDLLTTQMTESYSVDGTAPTLAQALFQIQQMLGDFSISGTTLTVKKVDGSTQAMTFTLDSATAPTSITRSS